MRIRLPFVAISVVHLAAQLVGAASLAATTKTMLMPALALVLVPGLGRRGRWPAWGALATVGLFFSWLGDLALIGDGEAWFLSGVALFGLAQVAYAFTFRNAGDARRTSGRPGLAAPYVLWWVALAGFFLLTQPMSPFVAAVMVYGLLLGTMAWLANRINTSVAVGAALFVLSDSLIGLGGAGLSLPFHGFWVMLTYLAAQWLIVQGLVEVAGRGTDQPTGQPTRPASGQERPAARGRSGRLGSIRSRISATFGAATRRA